MFEQNDKRVVHVIGGMWSATPSEDEWEPLEKRLRCIGTSLDTLDYPGHGLRSIGGIQELSFDGLVQDRIDWIRNLPKPITLVAHSAGCLVAAKVVEAIPDHVVGIIGIAHGPFGRPFGNFSLPTSIIARLLKPRYLPAIGGRPVRLSSRDANLMVDEMCHVEIGPESGRLVMDIAKGCKIPHLKDLKRPSVLIIPEDDRMVPVKLAERIADYHGVPTFHVDGGHFAHTHPVHRQAIFTLVEDLLESWS